MEDRPGTDTLELDQQQEHDVHDQAVSVLSSIDEIQELEDAPVQQPRSRLTMEGEYLGVHIGPRARGDISSKASHYFLYQRIIQKDYQTLKVGYNLDVMRRSTCLARLFICALWSPAGKGLASWLSFVVSSVSLSLSHWYPGSGVVLDCIDF